MMSIAFPAISGIGHPDRFQAMPASGDQMKGLAARDRASAGQRGLLGAA